MTKLQRTSKLHSPIPRATRLVLVVWIRSGAWTLGSWSFAADQAAPSATPAPEPTPLTRIVTRLSTAPTRTARDWAEFARETVTWGSRLQSAQEQVPEGPIRDALSAVDLGSEMDPKTADWPKLREELEAFLKKPEEPPPQENQDQQNQDQQKQDQDQQQKDQSKQGQSGQDQNSSEDQQQEQQQQNQQQQNADQQKQDGKDAQNSPEQQQQPQEDQSAFGDMKDQPPPPSPEETQQVGGVPERKDGQPPPADPNLALPLQKLDQLKNQDSPAELFKLMEDPKDDSSRKTKKDW